MKRTVMILQHHRSRHGGTSQQQFLRQPHPALRHGCDYPQAARRHGTSVGFNAEELSIGCVEMTPETHARSYQKLTTYALLLGFMVMVFLVE